MRTTEEYRAMIPEEPPADLVAEMVRQELLDSGHMSFKCIGFEEADARTRDDDFYMDLRESFRKRPALLWCSECEKEMLAEYLPSDSKKRVRTPEDRYYDADFNEVVERSNADVIFCPSCGKESRFTKRDGPSTDGTEIYGRADRCGGLPDADKMVR